MAEPQVITRMTPPQVIRGKRRDIEAQLQKVSEEETLTLIIPGKELTASGATEQTTPRIEKSFREIFAPSQQGFDQAGMTDEELSDFVEAEVKQYRAERNAKEARD